MVRKASGRKNDQGTFGSAQFDGNSGTFQQTPGGLDGTPAQGQQRKTWILRKFHISIPLGGGVVNGHIFYRVTAEQHIEYSGNNFTLIRSDYQPSFKVELGRRSLVWDILATSFYRAAVAGAYPNVATLGPPTITVGPQTSASFDDEQGL